MAKEIKFKGYFQLSGNAYLKFRIWNDEALVMDNLSLTESTTRKGYFFADMPDEIDQGVYDIEAYDDRSSGKDVIGLGVVYWDGEKELSQDATTRNFQILNDNIKDASMLIPASREIVE